MKYIPLFGEEAKHRDHIGRKWNRKYIRAIQSILNVTKGIVAPGQAFFDKAFGATLTEFNDILHMPEEYIVYRYFFEGKGFTEEWRKQYLSLDAEEKIIADGIIHSNNFVNYDDRTNNPKILALLRHYTIKKEEVGKIKLKDVTYKQMKKDFDRLIKKDQSINLTLTYDFEAEVTKKKRGKISEQLV